MATLQINYFAPSIMRFTTFHVLLPNDTPPMMQSEHYQRKMKTLFLLHGYSGNAYDWLTGSQISELAMKYNLAVVLPSGDNSFYLNGKGSCNKYEDFIATDLIGYMRMTFGLAMTPEDTFIGGLSMGGFGAIHTALAHPDSFGRMFGLSSALICDNVKKIKLGASDTIADYDYYESIFGDPMQIDTSDKNPKHLICSRLANQETIQPIFMACGTEDFLIKENHDFRDFLTEHHVEVSYHESTGIHDWKFWNEYIEPAICWCVGSREQS